MRYVKPDYYEEFQCTADKCPDTCCAGWQIVIDEESFEKYLKLDGEFGRRMAASLDYGEQSFRQQEGRCAFLNDKNLCDLIVEKGEDYLCHTCARYPRHIEEFEDVREYSLSLSCPVAAELILSQQKPLELVQEEDDREDPLAEEFEDFDCGLFSILEETRDLILEMVQNRRLPVNQRLKLVLLLAGRIQYLVDEGRSFETYDLLETFGERYRKQPRELLEVAEEMLADNHLLQLLNDMDSQHFQALQESLDVLFELERLRPEWTEVLEQGRQLLVTPGPKVYEAMYREFFRVFGPGATDGKSDNLQYRELELYKEQIAVFFLFTYFCGGVYDDMVYSKVALAIFSVCLLEKYVMCRWFLADKKIEKADYVDLSYRYAREVEHSDENLIFLEEWMMERYQPVEEEI